MSGVKAEDIKKSVREGYARVARQEGACCPPGSSVCGKAGLAESYSKAIGYSEAELGSVPEGANLGLGCGNPVALASLRKGETVLDLGSGAGFDAFLAARKVGDEGKVIGVDMTPDMLDKARKNAAEGGYHNVEFRLGEIENLPIADSAVDVVISNCVINLSPDKRRVFEEAYRVLKPGGRLMISDIVVSRELPDFIKDSIEAYIGCVSGAMVRDDYLRCIETAGFKDIRIMEETPFPFDCLINDPTARTIIEDARLTSEEAQEIAGTVISLRIHGYKGK